MLLVEPPEIKSGPTNIITSGTVISFNKNPIEIIFGPANGRLKLIIEFEEDKEIKGTSVKPSITSKDTLNLKLINYNNSLGTGNKKPLVFGNIEGRELYLNYRVFPLNEWDKTVHYTIYLGEDVST